MPSLKKFLKNFEKRINFVFFVDEQKTHHFKISYLIFKCLAILFIAATIFIGVMSFLTFKTFKENKYLSEVVVNLKNHYIHNYFASHFNNTHTSQDEIEEYPKENKTEIARKDEVASPVSLPVQQIAQEVPQPPPPAIATDAPATPNLVGIEVNKEKILTQNNKIILSFWLSNTRRNKNSAILGSVCAQLEGEDSSGKKMILNYPENLIRDGQGNLTAASCLGGERVKFNRLRPVVFEFQVHTPVFKGQKVLIYFSEKNKKKPVVIKEFMFRDTP